MRSLSALAILIPLATSPLAGQTILGTIVEEGSSHPVAGGFVVLLGADGTQRAATLSDGQGRFQLVAPGPGEYGLGVDRIGYLSVRTPVFQLPAGRTIEYRLAVRVEPVELAGIDVEVDSECHVRPGEELASARVWEEARKALNATAWTQGKGLLRYEVRSTERQLDPWTQKVEGEQTRTLRGVSRGSPYVALEVSRLAEGGFAHLDGETQVYYAPDATTLLSDWFLDHHCFRLVPSSEAQPGLVGLAFEPAAEGKLVDLRGTLWLDERTAELSHLDFDYTGLPASMGRVEAGGRVDFDRLPTGEWIVPRWRIRMPVVRWAAPDLYDHLTMDAARRGAVLLAFEEDIGEVIDVVPVGSDDASASPRHVPSEPLPFEPPPAPVARALPEDPIPAEPIDVVLEEAEARSRGESRYVITAEDIPETPMPLGRILERRIPGLRHSIQGSCPTLRTRNGVVRLVVLDGQRIYDTCILSLVQPQDVERIEFLPSMAASIEYGEVRGGGVLVITTRRGGG
ncbi:MAG TPA: TonB-dependent receptor [Gemmatimonadota bacterium]|nr:TonB-dependent receptor [Gemmatimonadota bacterium]